MIIQTLTAKKRQTQNNGVNNINVYVFLGDSLLGVPLSPALVQESGGFDSKYQFANRVKIYYKPDRTSTDNGSWQLYRTRESGGNPITRMPGEIVDNTLGPFEVGIDQAFIYGMDNSSIGKSIAVIKVAKGGSCLTTRTLADNDWVPANGELDTAAADYFIKLALQRLTGYGKVTVKAMIVSLGTNDAATSRWNQAAYLAAVPAFCSRFRAVLGSSSIPIYWGQVRADLANVSGFDSTTVGQARTILVNCKSGGSTAIPGFNLIETEWESDATIDGVHPTEASCLTRGAALATTMIALGE